MAKLSDLKKLFDEARSVVPVRRSKAATTLKTPLRARAAIARADRDIDLGKARARVPVARPDRDIDLGHAFADVRKLPPNTRIKNAPPRLSPIPRQRIADDAAALIASKYGAEPSPEAWDIGQELEAGQTFLRRSLSSDILKKLRRGHWSVQSEIDLHGHTIFEAHDALSDFLDDARAHGYRCVRVIHGKGLTSPNREPVLKGKVRSWLSRWDAVLAYCEAPPHAGGGGAVLILLRGR